MIADQFHELEKKAESVIRLAFPEADIHLIISTILPRKFIPETSHSIFSSKNTKIYYSLYSLDPGFRKKWLPNAATPEVASVFLKQFYEVTGHAPRVHHCFIKGENDSEEDVMNVCRFLNSFDFPMSINIVRYNSFSQKFGSESSLETIEKNIRILRENTKGTVKIVNRVGIDISASCGMFVENNVHSN